MSRKLIEAIYKKKARNDDLAVDLANALNKDIETGFFGDCKYIFELIQNADDAYLDKQAVNIELHLAGDYLIFSHNGKQFSDVDVKRISSYALQSEGDKLIDVNKTGYKGIGFKAVFSISDYVCIKSGEYCFRFDKGVWDQDNADKNHPYPWPVIPIWTEFDDLDQCITQQINNERVSFIIRLKSSQIKKTVKKDLIYLKQHPEIILFLRHTGQVVINMDGQVENIERRIAKEQTTLLVNNTLHSSWKIFYSTHKILEAIHNQLQSLSDYVCPPKLKHAKTTDICLALQLKDGHLVSSKSYHLYTYLPTTSCYKLPILINADFSLNAERTTLLNNSWNQFLWEHIAFQAIDCLQKVARDDNLVIDMLEVLIPKRLTIREDEIARAYQQGLHKGLAEIKFLPAMHDSSQLLTLSQCYIDEISLWQALPFIKIEGFLKDQIVRHDLKKLNILTKYDRFFKRERLFTEDKFCDHFVTIAAQCQTIDRNKQLLLYIQKLHIPQVYYSYNLLYKLRKNAFVLSAAKKLLPPEQLYSMNAVGNDKFAVPDCLSLEFVHPELIDTKKLTEGFFKQLGVRPMSRHEVVSGEIMVQLKKRSQKPKNAVELLRFVFNEFLQDTIKIGNIEKINEIYLLTAANTFAMAKNCLVCDCYRQQTQQLDPVLANIKNKYLISALYLQEGDNKEDWVRFFAVLGLLNPLNLQVRAKYYYKDACNEMGEKFRAYHETLPVRSRSSADQRDYMTNFMTMALVELLADAPELSQLFWHSIIDNWEEISKYRRSYYGYGNCSQGSGIISYLEYQLKENIVQLPTLDGGKHNPSSIYAPNFYELYEDLLPIATTISISEEMVSFFGFKTELDIGSAKELLKKINSDIALERIIKIHKNIFNLLLEENENIFYRSFDFFSRRHAKLSKDNVYLLAQNNQLCSINGLKYVVGENADLDESSILKNYPGYDVVQMRALCKLFDISVVQEMQPKLFFRNQQSNSEPKDNFFKSLALISLVEAKSHGCDKFDKFTELKEKLQQLQSYQVEAIKFADDISKNAALTAYLLEDKLYFTGYKTRGQQGRIHKLIAQYLKLSTDIAQDLYEVIDMEPEDLVPWMTQKKIDPYDFRALINGRTSDATSPEVAKADAGDSGSKQLSKPFSGLLVTTIFNQDDTTETEVVLEDEEQLSNNFDKLSLLDKSSARTPTDMREVSPPVNPFLSLISPQARGNQSEFAPKLEPSELNLTEIDYFSSHKIQDKSTIHSPLRLSPRRDGNMVSSFSPKRSHPNVENNYQIGIWGEECVYQKLIYHYKKKYPAYTFQQTEDGFSLNARRNPFVGSSRLTVIWCNKNKESYRPYDLIVARDNINGKTDQRYIEVKSTIANSSATLFISGNEWRTMMQHGNRYRLFRVYAVGRPEVTIKKFKNPGESIKNDELIPTKCGFDL